MVMRRYMETLATGRETMEMSILDFALAYELSIVNSYSKEQEERLVTFKNRNTRTHIDFFPMRANSRSMYKDYKLIPSECLMAQHRLLVMNLEIKSSIRMKRIKHCDL